jgi:hypothetical protein
MNKRIKELAKEAGFDWALKQASLYQRTNDKECIEKFAELLIRDCAKQVNHLSKQGGGTWGEVILTSYNISVYKK